MERADVEAVTSTAAKLQLWLSGDIEVERDEVLDGLQEMLELVLDALTRLNQQPPK